MNLRLAIKRLAGVARMPQTPKPIDDTGYARYTTENGPLNGRVVRIRK